ncbi:hypothetical protein D030_1448B, partial [Vibrio parahaemolyticus AQ3810]
CSDRYRQAHCWKNNQCRKCCTATNARNTKRADSNDRNQRKNEVYV